MTKQTGKPLKFSHLKSFLIICDVNQKERNEKES